MSKKTGLLKCASHETYGVTAPWWAHKSNIIGFTKCHTRRSNYWNFKKVSISAKDIITLACFLIQNLYINANRCRFGRVIVRLMHNLMVLMGKPIVVPEQSIHQGMKKLPAILSSHCLLAKFCKKYPRYLCFYAGINMHGISTIERPRNLWDWSPNDTNQSGPTFWRAMMVVGLTGRILPSAPNHLATTWLHVLR